MSRLPAWLCAGLLATAGATASAGPVRAFTFDTDAQGWTAQFGGNLVHRSSKGPHGGYLQISDVTGEDFVVVAPPEMLGSWRRFVGGSLVFQARNGNGDSPDWAPFGTVTLSDGVQTLTLDAVPEAEPVAGAGWRTYVVPLTAEAWGAALPTVLRSVQSLTIKLEFHNGISEVVHFDNVRLRPAPSL